jgi:hypothetical protein
MPSCLFFHFPYISSSLCYAHHPITFSPLSLVAQDPQFLLFLFLNAYPVYTSLRGTVIGKFFVISQTQMFINSGGESPPFTTILLSFLTLIQCLFQKSLKSPLMNSVFCLCFN